MNVCLVLCQFKMFVYVSFYSSIKYSHYFVMKVGVHQKTVIKRSKSSYSQYFGYVKCLGLQSTSLLNSILDVIETLFPCSMFLFVN